MEKERSHVGSNLSQVYGKLKVNEFNEIEYIEREKYGQGYVYKDYNGIDNRDIPCYVPELVDTVYTYNDIIEMCGGNENVALYIFETIDWQSPSTLLNELEENNELEDLK